jgi:hypothetical protein
MMDLSILVFFQQWIIARNQEMNHNTIELSSEGDLNRHPPQQSPF